MVANQIIMVQVADHEWNQQALCHACTLARGQCAKIALVKMIPVQHISWLGTELGNLGLTDNDFAELEDCAATVEDYGVEWSVHYFQYMTLPDALAEAAEHVAANVVFATLPSALLPWWERHQTDSLRYHLAQQHRVLFDKASLFETVK